MVHISSRNKEKNKKLMFLILSRIHVFFFGGWVSLMGWDDCNFSPKCITHRLPLKTHSIYVKNNHTMIFCPSHILISLHFKFDNTMTCCKLMRQCLLIVKKSRAQKINQWYHVKQKRYVRYSLKITLYWLSPQETVLQTSATNIPNQKVANYFSDGVVISVHTA